MYRTIRNKRQQKKICRIPDIAIVTLEITLPSMFKEKKNQRLRNLTENWKQ